MGKVIKRSSSDSIDTPSDSEFSDVGRRSPIIERSTIEARSQADEIREKAQNEAEALIAKAQEEAEALRTQAREEGYAQGRDQGAQELTQIVAQSSQRLNQIETQLVSQVKDLALSIARKILGRELATRPEAVVELVKEALAEKARQRREISLRINPDDMAVIRENRSALVEVLSRAKEISIREDPDVARFGVIIETDAGTIDAQLETQLNVIEGVLRQVR